MSELTKTFTLHLQTISTRRNAMKTKLYLQIMWGGTEPEIEGPFDNDDFRVVRAATVYNEDNTNSIARLNVPKIGGPYVSAFSNQEIEDAIADMEDDANEDMDMKMGMGMDIFEGVYTYRDLKEKMEGLSEEQLNMNITVFLQGIDEFYPAHFAITTGSTENNIDGNNDVLDPNHPVIIV